MDYLRSALTILAGFAAAGSNLPTAVAAPVQELVLTGRLQTEPGNGGGLAVRLRCPGFQTETRATGYGYFTIRMPRPSDTAFSSGFASPDRGHEDDSFSAHHVAGSMDCTLEVFERNVLLTRFQLAVPPQSQHIDLGDLGLPDPVGPAPGGRPTVHWSSLAAPPEASTACRQARRELKKNRPDLARANRFLEEALRLDPKMAEAWGLLGLVEEAKGDTGSARSDFEKALKLDGGSSEVHTFLAQLEIREQNWRKALEQCNSALETEPAGLQAQYLRAFAAYNLGNFVAARDASRRIRTSGQKDRFPDIVVVEGLLLAQEGKTAEASSVLRAFLEQYPDYRNRSALEYRLRIWREAGSE